MPPSNPQYDFILNPQQNQPQQQPASPGSGKFFLPKKTIFIVVGALLLLVIGVAVLSSVSKKSGPTDQLVAVIGTAQEMARVSDLVSSQSKDIPTLSLTATSSTVLTSEAAQFDSYITEAGLKYEPIKLSLYKDAEIDASLATAAQNNTVEQTYNDFMKKQLETYKKHLQALGGTKSKTLIKLVQGSYDSTNNILASPQLKN